MNIFKKLTSLFGEIKKEVNPVNSVQPLTSISSSLQQIYSTSSGTSSITYHPSSTTGNNAGTGQIIATNSTQTLSNPINMDTWIVDGSNHYNLSEMCRQFSKLQKTVKLALTPINEIALLMTDEDKETRELATIYYEKFKSDLESIKEHIKDEK